MRARNQDTVLGVILISMGVCEQKTIEQAILENGTERIGEHLIRLGKVTARQVSEALDIQKRLRSSAKHVQAIAQAEIARHGFAAVESLTTTIKEFSAEVRKQTTGKGYPAVTPEMLAGATNGSND